MSPEYNRKQKNQQPKSGFRRTLDGVLERLREGLEDLAEGLRPAQPQPIPIPVPVNRPRRR
jgi:hypothetical protein